MKGINTRLVQAFLVVVVLVIGTNFNYIFGKKKEVEPTPAPGPAPGTVPETPEEEEEEETPVKTAVQVIDTLPTGIVKKEKYIGYSDI